MEQQKTEENITMKTIKRIITLLLAVLMIAAILPLSAFADSNEVIEDFAPSDEDQGRGVNSESEHEKDLWQGEASTLSQGNIIIVVIIAVIAVLAVIYFVVKSKKNKK